MGIKKYAAISMVLLIFAFFTAAVNAEELKAHYLVEGDYNAKNKTYTVEVYLDTQVYLAAGTFGMEFGENVPVVWNNGYMNINTEKFERLEAEPFKDYENTFRTNRQIVVQWGLNETDISEPIRGTIKLGSFTMENVTPKAAKSWGETPFTLLDWTTTAISATAEFTQTDKTDGYGKSLNDEIWRTTSDTERKNGAPVGYYQGYDYDGGEWIDIGFEFTTNLNNEIKIVGTVNAYNPKNDIEITAFGTGGAYTGEIKERIIYPDGRITYTYEISVKEEGAYNILIQKSAHLTYSAQTTVPENTDEHSVGMVTLICGDINGDEYIKYPDRAELIRFLNRQKAWTENAPLFNKADLNGDELVNLFDLSILKANLDKTY